MTDLYLHSIIQRLPASIAILLGQELRYDFVNESMQALLGGDKPLGKPLAAHPGPFSAELLQVMGRVYRSGQPYVAPACLLQQAAAPGQAAAACVYYDLTLEPIRDEQQHVSGLLLFAVDVTQQQQARERAHELAIETRRLDARLRVLTETAPLITFTLTAANHVEYLSPQWFTFTGQPATADLQAIWVLLIHPDDRLRVLYQLESARKAGTGWSIEYRLRRHDGQYRWMLNKALPELHLSGEPVFWHGALTEVHDQRELADALRRGEAEVRFLADSIPQLVWTASAEGFIDYYNQFTGDYSGLPTEELGPTGWISLLHSSEQTDAAGQWVHSVVTGEDFEGLFRMRRHDGVYRWHIIRARQLADGQILRWFGACTDVDDQHRLRLVLQAQYDELAVANRDLDTFVYTASHDLKQPVLNLRGLFEELRRNTPFDEPDQAQLVALMEQTLEQLDQTLYDLAMTVQEQRGLSAPSEELDMRHALEEVLLGLRAQVQQTDALVEVDVKATPMLVYGRANLRSVLHNLLSNALKFADPQRVPHIRIRGRLSPAGHPMLLIEDNGLGMKLPDAIAPNFRAFERQHTQIEGAGIGLYLVQRIVASRGGRLAVRSEPGQGTTFTIYWQGEVLAS